MPLIAILPLLLYATLEPGNGRFNPYDPHYVINAIFLGTALWVALTPFPEPDVRAPAALVTHSAITRNRAAREPMPPRRTAQMIAALVCLVFYMGFGVYLVWVHLSVETQRQWSDKEIARTTPILLGLYSLVCLWAEHILETHHASYAAAWYSALDINKIKRSPAEISQNRSIPTKQVGIPGFRAVWRESSPFPLSCKRV